MRQAKHHYMAIVLVFALIVGALFSQTITFERAVEAQGDQSKRWEMMVVRGTNVPESVQGGVNMRGEEGWELVSVVQTKDGGFTAFLKRRK